MEDFLETVGTYNPIKKDAPVTVNEEKALYWLSKGAILLILYVAF